MGNLKKTQGMWEWVVPWDWLEKSESVCPSRYGGAGVIGRDHVVYLHMEIRQRL